MAKIYKDRAMTADDQGTEVEVELGVFFFPKHVPPVTIYAANREEAEKALLELDKTE